MGETWWRRTWLWSGLVAVALVGIVGWYLHGGSSRGDPDPGGKILQAVSTAAWVVPADATVLQSHYDEPAWNTCDGIGSTGGWSDVVVDITFESGEPPGDLLFHAGTNLSTSGWTAVGTGIWERSVPGETSVAQATLTQESGLAGAIGWHLRAHASPLGKMASGC